MCDFFYSMWLDIPRQLYKVFRYNVTGDALMVQKLWQIERVYAYIHDMQRLASAPVKIIFRPSSCDITETVSKIKKIFCCSHGEFLVVNNQLFLKTKIMSTFCQACVCDLHLNMCFADTDENAFKCRGFNIWEFSTLTVGLWWYYSSCRLLINNNSVRYEWPEGWHDKKIKRYTAHAIVFTNSLNIARPSAGTMLTWWHVYQNEGKFVGPILILKYMFWNYAATWRLIATWRWLQPSSR